MIWVSQAEMTGTLPAGQNDVIRRPGGSGAFYQAPRPTSRAKSRNGKKKNRDKSPVYRPKWQDVNRFGTSDFMFNNASVAVIFEPDRDSKRKVPYHLDGDPKMETARNKEIRKGLRKNAGILDGLKRFSVNFGYSESKRSITREEYISVHKKIAKALIPKLSEKELQKTAEDDWEDDTDGSPEMSYEKYEDSMFELTDIWTQTTDSAEYLSFLDALSHKIKYTNTHNPTCYDVLGASDADEPVTPMAKQLREDRLEKKRADLRLPN